MVDEQEDTYAGLKRVRKFLIVLLVIFCIASFAYSMVTLNFLRKPLEEKFGGTLKVNGDIKLGMDGFHPTLVAHDVAYGNVALKKAEMRIPFAAPEPGKPIDVHMRFTALTLPSRPPIDIDLPAHTDTVDKGFDNFVLRSGESLVTGSGNYRGGVLDIKATGSKIDYGLLYPGSSGGAVEGTFTLQGVDAEGKVPASSLTGGLSLKGGKGKIPGRALALWGGNLLSALLPNDAVVNCAVAEFDIKNGIATVTRLAVDTENLNITGTGTISISNMYMNIVFTPQPKASGTVNTAVPLQVSGVTGEATATPIGAPVAANASAPSPCAEVSP